MSNVSVREDVEEFVVARSDRLLRTAYLLTADAARAERLLQAALAEAWTTWDRSELPPEKAVLAAMARRYLSWRRLPSPRTSRYDGPGDPAWRALSRVPRSQRVVVVLRQAAGLSTGDVAEVLGWPAATVARREAQAATPSGVTAGLPDRAPDGPDVGRRLAEVQHRAAARRTRQRVVTVVAVPVVTAAMLAVGIAPRPPHRPVTVLPSGGSAPATPLLLGSRLPHAVHVWDREYRYVRSEVSTPGTNPFTVMITPGTTRALAWVSPGSLPGRIVVVVDGHVVRRDRAGMLRSALVVSGRTSHLVTLRATRPRDGMRLGLALYR